jgi:TonB-linked SusC/RagA family outer membrane protein
MKRNRKLKLSDLKKIPIAKICFLILLLCITHSLIHAQSVKTIAGIVVDESGEPLIGVNVVVKGASTGNVTDIDGNYSINITGTNAVTLIFSYVGYITQEVPTGGRSRIDITLSQNTKELGDVVVVGYGVQKRTTITGAVSSVKGDEINIAPVTNASNALAGRIPGVLSYQRSGEPGKDGSTIRIRGVNTFGDTAPLVVVDGVPGRSLERIDANSIENITVLKDASAAIYGSRAANGVILITTKRGSEGKPEIDIKYNQGFNQPTRIPEMCDAVEYATMMNELNEYRGIAPRYTPDEIQKFGDGSDPWRYPNVDYFKETFKSWSMQNDLNVSLSGGSERVNYYVSAGFKNQDGYYKESATYYKQYDFRSNLDAKVTKNIKVGFDVAGRMEDRNYPAVSLYSLFRMLMRGKPTDHGIWPNGLPGPDLEGGYNAIVNSKTGETGYDREKRYVLNSNIKLDVTIPWIKGLSLTGNASFDKTFMFRKLFQKPWYLYSWDGVSYDGNNEPLMVMGKKGFDDPRLQEWMEDKRELLLNALVNYETKFDKHGLRFLVGMESIQGNGDDFNAYRRYFVSTEIDQLFAGGDLEKNNGGSGYENARLNYFGRINYNFDEKFLLELLWRYDGSYIFPKEKRYGFFPGVSAGWRISEEAFWKDKVSFIDRFKLRASWGQTGNDRIDEWQYLATYGMASNTYYVLGVNQENKLLSESRIPNQHVTWEVANQTDIGFEGAILNNKLSFEFDYFYNVRNNILWKRNASVPTSTGLTLPRENIGKVRNQGVDFMVGYQDQWDDFRFNVSLNGGYAKNKIVFWDEAPGAPEWQQSTGKPIGSELYYEAIGIFKDQADVDSYPHWQNARPGDIIFRDVNDDGKIDADDRVRNSKSTVPRFTGGVNVGLFYKQVDLSLLFQGSAGAVVYISTESGDIGNFLKEYYDERWTPSDTNAKGPRVNVNTAEYWLNGNTHFLYNTDYIRLRNLEFGYSIPQTIVRKLGVTKLRFYLSGYNLLTFCPGLKNFDPEMDDGGGRGYSVPRVVNFGVNLSF